MLSDKPEQLQGRFTQEKYLSVVDAYLNSSGLFSYQRDAEILWETKEPVQSKVVLTPTAIVNRQGEREIVSLDSETNPMVGVLSEIFFAVFTADWNRLSGYFAVSGEQANQQWRAELIPLDAVIKQVVSRVELKGDTLLREVVLYESGGDYTRIHFHELSR